MVGNPSFSRLRRSCSSLADCGLYYGHFATSFRMVFVPRIVNGTRSTFARGTVAKSDVSGFLRRHQYCVQSAHPQKRSNVWIVSRESEFEEIKRVYKSWHS